MAKVIDLRTDSSSQYVCNNMAKQMLQRQYQLIRYAESCVEDSDDCCGGGEGGVEKADFAFFFGGCHGPLMWNM